MNLTEQEWQERFKPIENPLTTEGRWGNLLYDTHGPEYELVQQADPACVWTLLDCDGQLVIGSGWHWVNREGYFICEVPVPEGEDYDVPDEDYHWHPHPDGEECTLCDECDHCIDPAEPVCEYCGPPCW